MIDAIEFFWKWLCFCGLALTGIAIAYWRT